MDAHLMGGKWSSFHLPGCFYSNLIGSITILVTEGAGSLQALPVLTLPGLLMSVCGPGALMHPIGTQIENTCRKRGAVIHLKLLPMKKCTK